MVNELDIRRQVKRLATVYNATKTEDEIVAAWKWVLGDDVDAVGLMSAVSEYAKSGARYYPTPGQIRELAVANRPVVHTGPATWDQTQDGPCPVCGAVLQLVTAPGSEMIWRRGQLRARTRDDPAAPKRYMVLHDASAHEQR